jgi:ribosomal protein S18 acetylase RimI-like enzyme
MFNYYWRRANSADRDFLYRLKAVCLKQYVAAIWGWDEADQRQRFNATFDPAAGQILVAFGRDVGQLSITRGPAEIYINGIYLLPAYQRQGLGSLILSDLLAEARQCKRAVRLQVLVGNPARNLYERLGFEVIDRTDSHTIMRTRLHKTDT